MCGKITRRACYSSINDMCAAGLREQCGSVRGGEMPCDVLERCAPASRYKPAAPAEAIAQRIIGERRHRNRRARAGDILDWR